MAASKLELIAIQKRAELMASQPKGYNDADDAHHYSVTHTKALADSTTPEQGRGTGDNDPASAAENQNGGTKTDIFGNPNIPGSGRNPAFSMNHNNPTNRYGYEDSIDTSGNVGQVVLNG